jgi:hypothetical protein
VTTAAGHQRFAFATRPRPLLLSLHHHEATIMAE